MSDTELGGPPRPEPLSSQDILAGVMSIGAAICCLLPWYVVSLKNLAHAVGDSFRGVTGASFPGMGESMGNMFGQMNMSGTLTVDGVENWWGVVAMIASALAALVTFVQSSEVVSLSRRTASLVISGLAALSCVMVVYGLTLLSHGVGMQYGMGLALLVSLAAAALSIGRLRESAA